MIGQLIIAVSVLFAAGIVASEINALANVLRERDRK